MRATEATDVLWVRSPEAERGLLAALDELDAEYIDTEIDPATGIERPHRVTASFVRSRVITVGEQREIGAVVTDPSPRLADGADLDVFRAL